MWGKFRCKHGVHEDYRCPVCEGVSESSLTGLLCKKSEFVKRYIDRLKPLCLAVKMANDSAEAAFEQWDGVDTPEDCADYEMECWAADA